jgi:hypothetical protein
MKGQVKQSEYKGKPTLSLPVGENSKTGEVFYFTFGLTKAKAIIEHMDSIEDFIIQHEKE